MIITRYLFGTALEKWYRYSKFILIIKEVTLLSRVTSLVLKLVTGFCNITTDSYIANAVGTAFFIASSSRPK